MHLSVNRFLILITTLFLMSCGGGGSGGSGEVKTGQFFDSPVSGLAYETESGLSGVTNSKGEFQYREGEIVTFKLGKTTLGSVRGDSRISPFDLFIIPPPLGLDFLQAITHMFDDNLAADAFEHTVNMLIFLQSLDVDNDPDNGIDIPPAVADFFLLIFEAVLFDQESDDFAAEFFVLFFQLVTEGLLENRGNDPQLVEYDDALKHFYKELGKDIPL